MKKFFARVWPAAKVAFLEREREQLSNALASATRKTVELQSRLDEAHSLKCESCEALKQVVNFHVLAAGSRVVMFDGYGPTLPPMKYADKPPDPVPGKQRARSVAGQQNKDFVEEFNRKEQQLQEMLQTSSEQIGE